MNVNSGLLWHKNDHQYINFVCLRRGMFNSKKYSACFLHPNGMLSIPKAIKIYEGWSSGLGKDDMMELDFQVFSSSKEWRREESRK